MCCLLGDNMGLYDWIECQICGCVLSKEEDKICIDCEIEQDKGLSNGWGKGDDY